MSKLTLKEEKAVQEYFSNGGNKTAAYKSAYNTSRMKDKTINEKASRFFASGKISARVKELQKELEEENKISRDWVLEKAKIMVERSLRAEPIFTRSGDFTGEFKYDSAGAGTGLKIINQMLGYNAPEKKETVSSETTILPDWFKSPHD